MSQTDIWRVPIIAATTPIGGHIIGKPNGSDNVSAQGLFSNRFLSADGGFAGHYSDRSHE